MKKLLIGTSNPAKFDDYKRLLSDLDLDVVSPKEVGLAEAPQETGRDYEENAVIKAKFYYQKTGIPSLVDDGGLEVPVLNNEPGIKSHRWIGREM
ncbi:MAG: non-canonical purine NTP pyrophosphatase, partial [Candidatus Saccharibacteria bacterium]